jgi:PAS domain-containing protein
MDFSNIEDILKIVALVLGLLGTFYKIGKFVYTFLKTQYENITSVHNKIDVIFKEVTPNSGGSIKDKINTLTEQMSVNTQMTEKIFHRQRWILDNREEPIFESSEDGKCIWVNSSYTKILKRDISYFVEHGWKNAIHESDRDRVVEHWNDCVKDGRMYEDTYKMVDGEGKSILVECTAVKTHNNGYIGSLKIKSN